MYANESAFNESVTLADTLNTHCVLVMQTCSLSFFRALFSTLT